MARKMAAATACTRRKGMRFASASPRNTAGTFASIMPSVVPATDREQRGIARGERDGRNLRLVTPSRAGRTRTAWSAKTPKRGGFAVLLLVFVGHEHPHGHADERHAKNPAHHLRRDERGDPSPCRSRQRVMSKRRCEDAEHDRHGLAETRREHEREQLRLVAELGKRDHAGRNQERFHTGCGLARERPDEAIGELHAVVELLHPDHARRGRGEPFES